MRPLYLNLLSATAIGITIFAMARVRNVRTKALLYAFPIPVSISLIATHGRVSGSHLFGLLLVWLFFWVAKTSTDNLHMPIVLADISAMATYVVLGYVGLKIIHMPFVSWILAFFSLWTLSIVWMRTHRVAEHLSKPAKLTPFTKGAVAGVASFGIYSIQHVLSGIVVTFPYNGIFAVIEARHSLAVFSRTVVRNTLAVAVLFIVMYYLQAHIPFYLNLALGWLAFGITLVSIRRITV